MLTALRANENDSKFYSEYLKFEVKFLDKLMARRQVLAGQATLDNDGQLNKKQKDLAFIDDEEGKEEDVEGEVKKG